MLLAVLVLLGGGGALAYFKLVKGKQASTRAAPIWMIMTTARARRTPMRSGRAGDGGRGTVRCFTDSPYERTMMPATRSRVHPALLLPQRAPLPRLQAFWGGLRPALSPGRHAALSSKSMKRDGPPSGRPSFIP